MHPLLNIATQAARNAGKIILRFIDHIETVKVSQKNHNDFVTEVDRLAEQEIINVIRKSYPHHAIIAEESGLSTGNDFCWIIDPLDGTTNYIHGFPQYAISIAVKHLNKIEIGLIYGPIRNEIFTAAKGKGALLNNRRLRVTTCKQLEEALIGTGYPFKSCSALKLKSYLSLLEEIFPKVSEVRHIGSAALNLAYVAAGRLDGYWEDGLQEWDIAAGSILIHEAGGIVSDFNGQSSFLENGSVVAGNSKIHQLLLSYTQKLKSIHLGDDR